MSAARVQWQRAMQAAVQRLQVQLMVGLMNKALHTQALGVPWSVSPLGSSVTMPPWWLCGAATDAPAQNTVAACSGLLVGLHCDQRQRHSLDTDGG